MEENHVTYEWNTNSGMVPYRTGLFLPGSFRARVDHPSCPYIVELQIRATKTEIICEGLSAEPRDNGPAVTTEGLRKIPLGRLLAIASGSATMKMKETSEGQFIVAPVDEFEHRQFAPRRRKRLTDGFLEEVADIYRTAFERGDNPVETIAAKLHGSHSSAGRWVMEARKRDFLGKAKPRQAGI